MSNVTKQKKRRDRRRKPLLGVIAKRQMKGYLFILPWLIGFGLFFAFPLVQSVIYSLSDVKITARARVVTTNQFKNFKYIFTKDIYFMSRLRAFVFDTIISLPIILVFSMAIALLLNQPIKLSGFFRTLFFLPVIVVSGPVLARLIDEGATTVPLIEQYGARDTIREFVPTFLETPVSNLFMRLILLLWYSGVPILINLAGLKNIDGSLYEAALIDGASSWVVFWKITLPSMRYILLLDSIYILVLLATSEINEVIMLIRDNMLNPSTGFGIAAAMAWIYALTMALLIGLVFLILKRPKQQTLHSDTRKRIDRAVHVQTARVGRGTYR